MYLSEEELLTLFSALSERFEHFALLMDCYSVFAAKMSKYKNPINEVGVTNVFGIDNPKIFAVNGINYAGERDMSPLNYINELAGFERKIFKGLYAGKAAKKLYRLYEYVK